MEDKRTRRIAVLGARCHSKTLFENAKATITTARKDPLDNRTDEELLCELFDLVEYDYTELEQRVIAWMGKDLLQPDQPIQEKISKKMTPELYKFISCNPSDLKPIRVKEPKRKAWQNKYHNTGRK